MNSVDKLLAKKLLGISAVKLQPKNPFTWASGWKSPIYTDNRKTLSFPDVRTFVKIELSRLIAEKFEEFDVIAGVATGAIAQGAMIADELGMPYVYIRSAAKDHGMGNLIEGDIKPGQKVVVVEDLISTGGSSLKAVEAVRQAGCEVVGMVAIFTYGFPLAEEKFKEAGVTLYTLSNYNAVLEAAAETGYINSEDIETLKVWRENPSQWMQE
ncbi:MAG: orotate phosphoribosyltransferase [Bacteroidales bacterium]|nr:orotate phosphoribosyltransferase [Bacteroidales bacterium]MBQ3576109.1 orotate phosphoribosyltransferase [Coprobacter sp.]MBR2475921.1 orotate phosphoribosyltransferase [Bacteroidaceae bacterium]MBQ3554986.1 orotate phosphoribosyltransferase [Bacteroidales bacterium]MBR3609794.1 orotate phosphoribosyltransferase [Bacteroidales bacterium]